jgi:hypothetical protein
LARWLRAHQIEAHVIHPSSVPVSREHRRRRRIGSIVSGSSEPFWAGCEESQTTAGATCAGTCQGTWNLPPAGDCPREAAR